MSREKLIAVINNIPMVVEFIVHHEFQNIEALKHIKNRFNSLDINQASDAQLQQLQDDYYHAIQSMDTIDDYRFTPLLRATDHSAHDVMNALLKSGVDVNVTLPNGWGPLQFAASHGDIKAVELLLQAGADVNAPTEDGETSLYWPVFHYSTLASGQSI